MYGSSLYVISVLLSDLWLCRFTSLHKRGVAQPCFHATGPVGRQVMDNMYISLYYVFGVFGLIPSSKRNNEIKYQRKESTDDEGKGRFLITTVIAGDAGKHKSTLGIEALRTLPSLKRWY